MDDAVSSKSRTFTFVNRCPLIRVDRLPLLGYDSHFNRVADLLDGGVLEKTLAQEMSWTEVVAAHRAIETTHTAGKIVLRIE